MNNSQPFNTGERHILHSLPNECPFCHDKIIPLPLFGDKKTPSNNVLARVLFRCPSDDCGEVFIGYYRVGNPSMNLWLFDHTSIGKVKPKEFHQSIINISPNFIEIYNQSSSAEGLNLLQVCGVGYRKALEFLIKDYSIKHHPEKKEEIESKFLGKVINGFITNEPIKQVAKRAVWIGNDETHYTREWATKDLTDLKNLIDMVTAMIQQEDDYDKLIESMPEPE